jgi:hypothetical protein
MALRVGSNTSFIWATLWRRSIFITPVLFVIITVFFLIAWGLIEANTPVSISPRSANVPSTPVACAAGCTSSGLDEEVPTKLIRVNFV